MATHSSMLAWIIPWTEEPGRLQSTGLEKSWTQPLAATQQEVRGKAQEYNIHWRVPVSLIFGIWPGSFNQSLEIKNVTNS